MSSEFFLKNDFGFIPRMVYVVSKEDYRYIYMFILLPVVTGAVMKTVFSWLEARAGRRISELTTNG